MLQISDLSYIAGARWRLYHDGLGTAQSQRACIPRLLTPRTILKETRREGGREGGREEVVGRRGEREGGKEGREGGGGGNERT